jgi:hypothetical protein
MLHQGFDLSASGVGFHPELGAVATPLAAFSLRTATVIVDTSRRSPTFEVRLQKYWEKKQFSVIFPSLVPFITKEEDSEGQPESVECGGQLAIHRHAYPGPELVLQGHKPYRPDPSGDDFYNSHTTQDYFGLTQLERYALQNFCLAPISSTRPEVLDNMIFVARDYASLVMSPKLYGQKSVHEVFAERALKKPRDYTLEILKMVCPLLFTSLS